MFFTYKYNISHSYGCGYLHCNLTCDIGPFKKGDSIRYIYRKDRSTVFKFCNPYLVVYELDLRVHSSARIIQRAWRRCISDPSYQVCKKRLLNEYNNVEPKKSVYIKDENSYNFELDGPEIFDPCVISVRQRIKDAKEYINYMNRYGYLYDEYQYHDQEEQDFVIPMGKRIFFM